MIIKHSTGKVGSVYVDQKLEKAKEEFETEKVASQEEEEKSEKEEEKE